MGEPASGGDARFLSLVRGRSGDAITAKSQRFTQGDLLGSEVSVGRRTKGRRLTARQKSEDRVLPEGGCNAR